MSIPRAVAGRALAYGKGQVPGPVPYGVLVMDGPVTLTPTEFSPTASYHGSTA